MSKAKRYRAINYISSSEQFTLDDNGTCVMYSDYIKDTENLAMHVDIMRNMLIIPREAWTDAMVRYQVELSMNDSYVLSLIENFKPNK